MISDMTETPPDQSPISASASAPRLRRPAVVLAGVAGCLLLVVATSARPFDGLAPFLSTPAYGGATSPLTGQDWLLLAVPAAVAVIGLCLLRWWPYLLAAAGLLAVPGILTELDLNWLPYYVSLLAPTVAYYLAIVALLACAQGLVRTAAGWGAVVAGLTVGSRLIGSALGDGSEWILSPDTAPAWHVVLLGLGFAGIAPAVWICRRGDQDADGSAGSRIWPRRVRMIGAGTLAAAVPIPLSLLTTQHLADLTGVAWSQLYQHEYAQTAMIGAIMVVGVGLLAALAGRWSLAGALTVALIQVAVVTPAILAISALGFDDPTRRLAAVAGAGLGAAAAGSRWRLPLAVALTVLAGTSLFIAYAATVGYPQKLMNQGTAIPGALILLLCAASATAVVGATAPILAPRGVLPVVLGPLAAALTAGGLQTVQLTNGLTTYGVSVLAQYRLTTSAVLLFAAGAAVAGLGFAQLLAGRRAERKAAEQIRREAAVAERARLARPIHDGVLQVLALVQRYGPELGGQGSQLAALAGEQELALRSLLTGNASVAGAAAEDLRAPLQALATSSVEVATPAQPVSLPADAAAEVIAAVRAALDNVRRHAGDGARAWIFLEDEQEGIRVTVRDDGVGFAPQRLAEAAEAGRLGVAQSMRGRIADRGGSTTIESRPGEGTEVEFWVPRAPRAPRDGR